MRSFWVLTVASLKMYLRQKEVVIWAFIFPLLLLGIFGFIKFDGVGTLHLGVVNEAGDNGPHARGTPPDREDARGN